MQKKGRFTSTSGPLLHLCALFPDLSACQAGFSRSFTLPRHLAFKSCPSCGRSPLGHESPPPPLRSLGGALLCVQWVTIQPIPAPASLPGAGAGPCFRCLASLSGWMCPGLVYLATGSGTSLLGQERALQPLCLLLGACLGLAAAVACCYRLGLQFRAGPPLPSPLAAASESRWGKASLGQPPAHQWPRPSPGTSRPKVSG